ncbi:MAG: hypothetical protein DHS20C21_03880 [Gemmatimonadota bacterium]|nr:MAG: hypothetical protein DHS20C21_03880 [Gemmatimonadota bacterium]
MFNKKTDSNGPTDYNSPSSTPSGASPSSSPASSTSSSSSPAASSASNGAATVLAEGCSFDGNAKVAGTLRIEGQADGTLEASDSIVVGKSGIVHATVKTQRAVLNGRFEGKIDAEDCVEMQSGSRVEAEVHARNMVMEDGVQFEGNCKIGK